MSQTSKEANNKPKSKKVQQQARADRELNFKRADYGPEPRAKT
jgi:hypothetical protein